MAIPPLVLLLVLSPPRPAAAANEDAALVLHAIPFSTGNRCDTPRQLGFDCRRGLASVAVRAVEDIDVYLFVHGHDDLAAVQCKFDWPPGWVFLGWRSQCRSNQIHAVVPGPGGERNLVTAFDRVSRPDTPAGIGWLQMTAGGSGCLSIVESDFPFGTVLVDGGVDPRETPVPADRRGSVCVGGGGVDGCLAAEGLPEASWGRIKTRFSR